MNSASPSCFYFPTTVLLVDDDIAFVENMRPLINNGIGIKIMDNPEKVIEELKNNFYGKAYQNPFLHKFNEVTDEIDNNHSIINIDIEKIHHEVYNQNRFSRISTLVVDYKMPKINGIEICRKFQNYPFNKTLLTGKADNKTAVSAFNEGVIDKFIQKSSTSMVEKVEHAVKSGKCDFFKKFSEPLLSALSKEPNCILNEDKFECLIKNIVESKKIIEYYIIDKFGSFLMLDDEANHYFLIVRTEEEIIRFHDIAVDNHAPDLIVDALRFREKMPVFLTEEEHRLPMSKWNNYLYNVKKFEGRQNYYYSIVENMETNYIDKNKITSYKNSGVFL